MNNFRKPFAIDFNVEPQLNNTIRPSLIVAKIFCVTPVDIDQGNVLVLKYWKCILHILWYTIVYIFLVYCIYIEHTYYNNDLPTIQKPLFLTEYLVYMFHVLFIMLSGYFKRTRLLEFIETFVNIDQKLMKFTIIPSNLELKKCILLHFAFLGIYTVITFFLNYIFCERETFCTLRSLIVYMLPNIIIGISLMQYYQLLFAIKLRWKSLVEILIDFQLKYQTDIGTLMVDPLKLIDSFRLLFAKLEMFTKDVNSLFSYLVLLVYFGSFLNIGVNIYLVYKFIDQDEEFDKVLFVYSVVWVAMHVGKMFSILYYNQLIVTEKEHINLILNELNPHTEEMELTVRRFLLQLMAKSRAHVICNILDLNLSFVKSLLVNTSVLVIFLIQYDVTFEALYNTHATSQVPGV